MKQTKDFKVGDIYIYTSPSGKHYVGQTINESHRKYQHKTRTIKEKTKFGRALNKYGFDSFEYRVLIKFTPTLDLIKLKRVLDKLEKRYITLYKSDKSEFGYNLTKGGEGVLGFKHTEETKKYIGKCAKAAMTPERKLQISEQLKERSVPEERKELLRQKAKEKGITKQVYQYDLDYNLIRIHDSISDCCKSLNFSATEKTKYKRITEVCSGKYSSYNNFIFSFTILEKPIPINYDWLKELLEDREYSLSEIREVFIPILESKNLKIRQLEFINDYFPKYTKTRKWVNGIRDIYYKFEL